MAQEMTHHCTDGGIMFPIAGEWSNHNYKGNKDDRHPNPQNIIQTDKA